MKTKDALNRRSRYAALPFFADPNIEPLLPLLQHVNRHGSLPTPLIAKLDGRNYSNLQGYLSLLAHGYCSHPDHESEHPDGHECKPIRYLIRDKRQWKNINARYQPTIYSLSAQGEDYLRQRNKLARPFKRSNSFVHDLFLGCFTASFEIQARKFRFRDTLLAHSNCPVDTREEPAPFYLFAGLEKVRPDDIFGNEYEEGKSRFFALEIDQANESNQKTETRLKDYQHILQNGGYRRLGLPNITILYPTVTEAKAQKILRFVEQHIEPKYRPHFLTKVFPEFDDPWKISKDPLEVMTGWMSTKGEVDISKKVAS